MRLLRHSFRWNIDIRLTFGLFGFLFVSGLFSLSRVQGQLQLYPFSNLPIALIFVNHDAFRP